tara:strand:- start:264 stop:1034 length:771 start_codon:yes stop_codon:yes gene_type:complete
MKSLDLNNSYVYLAPNEKNCWRTNIKSFLENHTTNTKYFLTKECRAEKIGDNPFGHPSKSELCTILDNKKNRWYMRNIPFFKINEFGKFFHQKETTELTNDEILLNYLSLKKIDNSKVIEKLESRELKEIYSKISYEYENNTYTITSKVEYINFGGNKNKDSKYVQPICGYVPFIKNENIYIAYFAKYSSELKEGCLEFRLRSNNNLSFYIGMSDNFFKNIIKKIIILFFGKVKVSEFAELISIKKSKLEFFEIDN